MKFRKKAIQIFEDFMRLENRIPTREEWEEEYYGEEAAEKSKNKYYYKVKRMFLEEE